jgi:molybdate transport system substrate-binding protein
VVSVSKLNLLLSAFFSFSMPCQAAEVSVAVAANFAAPMQRIAAAFEQETGHKSVLSFGSSGNLYAQIRHGAPFEILLSADSQTPAKLESEGMGLAGTRFTYAIGTLVLWSKQPGLVDEKGEVLRSGKLERLAIANPKLAPYGVAAMQTLAQLGVLPSMQPKLVLGENISQAFQFVTSQNAPLGLVALSQVMLEGKIAQGSAWIVPASLHAPIAQDAILLVKGRDNPVATALLQYLRSDKAKAIMRSYGYTL